MKFYYLDDNGEIQCEEANDQETGSSSSEPQYEDLPVNENKVSNFEYHYGELAFHTFVWFVIVVIMLSLYFNNAPK